VTYEYLVEINIVEELQNTANRRELDRLFVKAKSTLVQGGNIILCRREKNGTLARFDMIDTDFDLLVFEKKVYQYL